MPCPHNEISIVQRSRRQSAVADAAYQSGEKLFCEYDQQVKHYPEKRGIVHNEILLPANVPQEYADRNTLWNAAKAVDAGFNKGKTGRSLSESDATSIYKSYPWYQQFLEESHPISQSGWEKYLSQLHSEIPFCAQSQIRLLLIL